MTRKFNMTTLTAAFLIGTAATAFAAGGGGGWEVAEQVGAQAAPGAQVVLRAERRLSDIKFEMGAAGQAAGAAR
jgi:hypothetical protein